MITYLFIRHGQSASNAAATLTGQLDIPLTEVGIKQGELASEYIFTNYKINAIYSSDLLRAYTTALPLSKMTNIPVIKEAGFREMNCGEWQGQKVSALIEKYGNYYKRWTLHDPTAFPPNGESFLALQKRVVQTLDKISAVNNGKTVAIATHGGVIKVLTAAVLNLPIEQWSEKLPYVSNASVTKIVYDNEKYSLIDTVDNYLGELKTQMPKGI